MMNNQSELHWFFTDRRWSPQWFCSLMFVIGMLNDSEPPLTSQEGLNYKNYQQFRSAVLVLGVGLQARFQWFSLSSGRSWSETPWLLSALLARPRWRNCTSGVIMSTTADTAALESTEKRVLRSPQSASMEALQVFLESEWGTLEFHLFFLSFCVIMWPSCYRIGTVRFVSPHACKQTILAPPSLRDEGGASGDIGTSKALIGSDRQKVRQNHRENNAKTRKIVQRELDGAVCNIKMFT